MTRTTMQKVFLKLAGSKIDLPGFSIGFAEIERLNSGWVVGVKGSPTFEGEDGQIEAFGLALNTTKTVSGYKDGDVELWNIIEVYETEAEATKAAKKNDQLYIYNIETSKFKWIW